MAFKFSSAYNTERLFNHNIDTAEFQYYSLEDIYESEDIIYGPIYAIYTSTKGIEPHPVLLLEDKYVNLPKHLLPMCKEICNDPRAVDAINTAHVGFTIYSYVASRYNNKICYSIRWVDM